jgi:hypothetical protein
MSLTSVWARLIRRPAAPRRHKAHRTHAFPRRWFRPRLEVLEDRLPLGDALLGTLLAPVLLGPELALSAGLSDPLSSALSTGADVLDPAAASDLAGLRLTSLSERPQTSLSRLHGASISVAQPARKDHAAVIWADSRQSIAISGAKEIGRQAPPSLLLLDTYFGALPGGQGAVAEGMPAVVDSPAPTGLRSGRGALSSQRAVPPRHRRCTMTLPVACSRSMPRPAANPSARPCPPAAFWR